MNENIKDAEKISEIIAFVISLNGQDEATIAEAGQELSAYFKEDFNLRVRPSYVVDFIKAVHRGSRPLPASQVCVNARM